METQCDDMAVAIGEWGLDDYLIVQAAKKKYWPFFRRLDSRVGQVTGNARGHQSCARRASVLFNVMIFPTR